MIYIAVCDDEKTSRDYAARLTEDCLGSGNAEVERFDTGAALLRAIEMSDYSPDIAILDIQMSNMDGITLAQRLNTVARDCLIIFLTGYDEFSSDVYETEHLYYVRKTTADRYLPSALQKAIHTLEKNRRDDSSFLLSRRGAKWRIPADDVIYLERNLHKTTVVTRSGVYDVSSSPQQLLVGKEQLGFINCHQSYWINFRHISGMDGQSFTASNGDTVPISRAKKAETRRLFFELLR